MYDVAREVVSIAEASLGGLRGRSALLLGPEEQLSPFIKLLRHANMKYIYQEDTTSRVSYLLPSVQLVIIQPGLSREATESIQLSAATIAKGCEGRRTPLVIMDLAATSSVEEMAGLLPTVCLYTPDDLRTILEKQQAKAS
jgi:glutamyl-tRNA reductase